MEYKDPGRYIPIIYLLYSWGSQFGVPSRVPLLFVNRAWNLASISKCCIVGLGPPLSGEGAGAKDFEGEEKEEEHITNPRLRFSVSCGALLVLGA